MSSALAKATLWTVGGYTAAQCIRFLTSVILARLLAPELFGVMVIINTLRLGVELLSDMGIAQCVIQAKDGEQPRFFNTAWTLQIVRGGVLFVICLVAAVPIALAYQQSILYAAIPAAAVTFLFSGCTSLEPIFMQRKMDLFRLNVLELINVAAAAIFQILIAYLYPSVWALVAGLVFGSAFRCATSFLVPGTRTYRIAIAKEHLQAVLRFGKWVTAASAIYFASTSFDLIYLGGTIPMAMLGTYGIARTIAEIVTALGGRIGGSVVLPYIASHANASPAKLRSHIAGKRASFVVVSALLVGTLTASSDIFIVQIYDERYHSAMWMLPLLLSGTWFALLSILNDSALLGLGRPSYTAFANGSKFVFLAVGLPAALSTYDILGAIIIVACSDIPRYVVLTWAQSRQGLSFVFQDAVGTFLVIFSVGVCLLARAFIGLPMAIP